LESFYYTYFVSFSKNKDVNKKLLYLQAAHLNDLKREARLDEEFLRGESNFLRGLAIATPAAAEAISSENA